MQKETALMKACKHEWIYFEYKTPDEYRRCELCDKIEFEDD